MFPPFTISVMVDPSGAFTTAAAMVAVVDRALRRTRPEGIKGTAVQVYGATGVVGGTALSIAPGEDTRYLLASLVVVIVGGMGSVAGAALGAVLVGLAEQFGLAYAPTYGIVFTFVVMTLVLAFRPQGILGRGA